MFLQLIPTHPLPLTTESIRIAEKKQVHVRQIHCNELPLTGSKFMTWITMFGT